MGHSVTYFFGVQVPLHVVVDEILIYLCTCFSYIIAQT